MIRINILHLYISGRLLVPRKFENGLRQSYSSISKFLNFLYMTKDNVKTYNEPASLEFLFVLWLPMKDNQTNRIRSASLGSR
jgi:hypothetical protein